MTDEEFYKDLFKETPKFETLDEFDAWLDEEEKNYVEDMSPECRENWDMKMDSLEGIKMATLTRSQIMEYIKKGVMTEDYLIDGLYCHVIEDDEKDK